MKPSKAHEPNHEFDKLTQINPGNFEILSS